MKELFKQPYDFSDPFWIIKGYFDRMYNDGSFIKSIAHIVNKDGFSTDGAYCNFPDMSSPLEEEHFTGVEFAFGYPPQDNEIVVVSEKICSKYIKIACEKYLQAHPEDSEKIKEVLSSSILQESAE